MIKFMLFIELKADDGSVGDGVLEKEVNWPVLPRIGEQLALEGNASIVTGVTHDISKAVVEVYTQVDKTDFHRLAAFDGYKRSF